MKFSEFSLFSSAFFYKKFQWHGMLICRNSEGVHGQKNM